MHQKSFHPEIQQFRDDLRACTDNEVHGSAGDDYAEAKFDQVKRILDRLRSRPEFTSDDRRWRALVTDVRNWYSFAASERWYQTNEEYENHSDTSGKSGGQKDSSQSATEVPVVPPKPLVLLNALADSTRQTIITACISVILPRPLPPKITLIPAFAVSLF